MISEEDESSSVLNGRLRPRKSTATIPNPPIKSYSKPEYKVAQDKPKRNNLPSKASPPNKQDDLTAKADSSPLAQFLCPYCDRKFTTKLSASKHARRIHPCTSKQDNFINCLFCNHSEAATADIIRHMVDNHPNQYIACLECKSRFLSNADLDQHKLTVCEKQKQAYRSKLRKKTSTISKKDQKKINSEDKNPGENKELEREFNNVVISCELKPSQVHEPVDVEDKITTNLILPSNISNTALENNAVIVIDDIQWNRRIPPNFSFRNADADQILSRLGVVHRSPRVGESTRREWLKLIDDNSQKFEKCFDTNFYSRVASNVQENLARFLDGSFNFSPDPDKIIKTRKSKSSAIINTAEGFPILLPHEQYSRNRFDGYMPRAIAPKHKWKWDSTENDKNIIIDANVIKRDNHVDNCIITLVSSLDIWTQLRMRRKYEEIFSKAPTEKIEKQNIIGRQLKEILESREIPRSKMQMVAHTSCSAIAAAAAPAPAPAPAKDPFEFPSFLGLSARGSDNSNALQPVPTVLSGEWVRPRCYVCCACGDQTRESRALTAHMAAHHPNAQVQHYEIVGESLLNADILKHLYVPPSQMSNRTRPLRGFRDCTKCKKSIALEELHQHMLDCAGDTPTVRRKCRSRPFGVRKRRPRLPDNAIRKKIRKDLRTRHNQKSLMRARPRIRTEVGDAETIRKMLADLPAKRHRSAEEQPNQQVLRPRRKRDKQRNKLKIKRLALKDTKTRKVQIQNDRNDSSIIDEDDQPLKPKTKTEHTVPAKKRFSNRVLASKKKKGSSAAKEVPVLNDHQQDAPTDDANATQPHIILMKNSTQTLNANTSENNIGEGENHDRPYNDEEREPAEDLAASDHTLLNHFTNNITAPDSTLQLQQQHLPQQTNTEEIIRDTNNVLLQKEVESSITDKPPLQRNQRSSSEKKRQSLLNCIEKIKSQQKGETMLIHTEITKKNRKASEPTHLSLLDPHPAVICCTRDKSGAAKNVVPDKILGPHTHKADELYLKEKYSTYQIRSDLETQRQTNETRMVAPIATYSPFHSEAEFTSLKAKLPFGYKSFAHNYHHPDSTQIGAFHSIDTMYARFLQPLSQQSLSERIAFTSNILLQPQTVEAAQNNYPVQYYGYPIPGQYDASDIHYGDRRDHVIDVNERNETTQYPYTTSLSPQSWIKESSQTQVANKNHTVRSMLSMSSNEPVIQNIGQTAQKRVSESSETDLHSNPWSLTDANIMLNYAYLRRGSFETTANVYAPLRSQGNTESPHYYNSSKRPKPQKDSSNQKYDLTSYTQDGNGRTNDNESAFREVTSIRDEHYHTEPSQTTATKYRNNVSPMTVKEGHSIIPHSENTVDDIHLHKTHKYLVSLYSSNLIEKKNHERFSAEHPHLSPSVPTETQAAKLTPSPNDSIIQKTIDTPDHNVDNIQISLNRKKKYLCSKISNDQETFENQTDSGPTEEPFNLSGLNRQAICNDERAFGVTHTHSVLTTRPQYYSQTAQIDPVRDIGSAFERNETNEDVPIDLSFKNNSRATHNKPSETAVKKQDMLCPIEKNNAEMAGAFERQLKLQASEGSAISSNRLDKESEKISPSCLNITAVYPEQNIFQKDSNAVDITYVQNQMIVSNFAAEEIRSNDNNPHTTISSIDHDPEAAKVTVNLPKSVLKKQHNDLLDEDSQMPENEGPVEPLVTDQTLAKVTQHVENTLIDANTPTICEALTNYSNNKRLTINTATLPSSSILPKKRHSPSSGLNSQDAYSNMTLSKSQKQPPSTITSILNRNNLSNAPGENSYDANNKRIDKIIDLTDDDLNHSKMKTLSSNVLPLQESIPKQQNTSKNFNEKTASLRAVRFKAPLARKSISDEKQPISKVYSQQLTCLDLSQKDRKTDQSNNFECDTINLTVDNTAQNAEYNANISTSEVKMGTTTKNVVQIESERSMAAFELRDQFKVDVVAYNATTPTLATPCLDVLPVKMIDGRKNTERDTLLVTSKSTIDVVCDSIKVTNIISDPMALSDSFNLTRPEQICDGVGNDPIGPKDKTGICIDSHVNATKPIVERNDKDESITALKPVITVLSENSIKNIASITKLNEDEDSDDDISLALIVQQKQLEQASAVVIDSNKNNIPKHTITETKSNLSNKPNKASKTDLDLLAMNTNTLNTVTEDEPLIAALKVDNARKPDSHKPPTINSMLSKVNEDKPLIVALMVDEVVIKSDNTADKPVENRTAKASYKNGVDKENLTEMKQDHEPNELTNNIEKEASGNYSNNEGTSENSLIDDSELTHASNEKSDDTLVFQINENKNIDMDCEANELLWKNNNQSKSIHANTQIDTVGQNNSKETEKNEIQPSSYINQKTNSNQPSNADDGNVSLVLENTKNIDKLNTPAELHTLSGDANTMNTNKEGTKKFNKPESDFNVITDSELSSNLKETNKRALRRSKRGKSMFTDKDSNNDDKIEVNYINVQKKPVTVKQLIFSKLLRNDNNLQSEKNINLTSLSAENVTDIKSTSALKMTHKRKTSPIKTKNKKTKSNDSEGSDLDNWNRTPENGQNLQQSHDTIDDNGSNTEVSGLVNVKSNNNSEVKTDNPDYDENKKLKPEKTNTFVEIRTACYNRPIGNNQSSTSMPMKKPENYDPYDIDLDMDMAETTRPIMKRKSNKAVSGNNSNKSSKKILRNGDPVDIIRQESDLANRKLTVTTPPAVSDSDSSISDAPLQKYVEEKEKLNGENRKSSDCNKLREASKDRFDGEIDSINGKAHSSNDEEASESKAEIAERETHLTNSTDDISHQNVTGIKDLTSQRNHETANVITKKRNEIEDVVDISTVKSDLRQKTNRESIISIRTESVPFPEIENETEQQLSPDKFMENFGFYINRQPRLCNIIALKKIAETFQNFKNDEDLLGTKDRQKKSSHIENKKTTVGARTLKLTQDSKNANSDRKSRSQLQDTGGSNMIDKQDRTDDDGELDVIMAQKMLETEDIRKLERELYSELKRAAVANAGKTSGLNHLRVEESHFHDSNIHDVGNDDTHAGNDTEMKTIKTPENPERIESPERSSSPEMPESPESLIKDKPLMYPEEEVNIYEDKYDIIKRRREATANAKQVPKIDKPRKSKIVKRQKKTERKNIKKITKKPIYQGSQVPTKGALKGFDGIKISIPTQDLTMPPNLSPPHHQQRQSRSRKRKETFGKANSGSSNKRDSYRKEVVTPDIYEFKDDERPVTEGYRLIKVNDKSISASTIREENLKIATQKKKYDMKGKDQEIEGAKIRKIEGKGKGKGKRTNADNETNKVIHEKQKKNKKEKQIKEKEPGKSLIVGSNAEHKMDDCEQPVETIVEDDDKLSNDSTNHFGTLQDNVEPFEDSDTDMQTSMPGTLRFVPDRNDESSYESDSSSRTPLLSVLKGPYLCTCLSEIDSDDSETERGCAHSMCRYSHLNAAKNVVMGKIFKSNAVRCDKPDESPRESPKPKPDMDRLFDSLLEPNANNNATETRINTSPVPGPSSASTFHLTMHSQTQNNKSLHDSEASIGEDGFSSPTYSDSDKRTKKVLKCASQAFSNDSNSLKEDDATHIFEKSDKPIHNKKSIMLVHKLVQTDVTRLRTTPAYDLKVDLETGKEPELLSKTHPYVYDRTSNHSLDLHKSRDNTLSTRGTQTKRSFPLSDIETSSCEGELKASKITKRKRTEHKNHKSHHKRYKVCQNKEFDEPKYDSKATASKQNSRSKIAIGENEKESIGKKRSNSHDDCTDPNVMALVEDTGVAVQRARRKCTVGKQNVLAEHWSSSESEAGSAPNRAKGRKSSVSKKISRTGKRERASKRSRGGESDDGETSETHAPAAPSVRARAASAVVDRDRDRDSGSDEERNVKLEQHGWIVGHSHKKLVTMLACCKSKPRIEIKEKEKKK